MLFLGSSIVDKNADTYKKRNDFISNLGYKVDEENVSVKVITIPYVFSDVYKNYNDIQKTSGYNLEEYRGKKVTLYTYCSDNMDEKFVINLLVFNGEIIGGDIYNDNSDNGFLPLVRIRDN